MAKHGEPRTESAHVYTLGLLGGKLCLDFVNTVDPRHGAKRREFLTSYEDLVAWGRYVGTLMEDEAVALLALAQGEPEEAARWLAYAVSLREAMYRLFGATMRGVAPDPADVEEVADAYRKAMACSRLVPREGGFKLGWIEDRRRLDRMLWPVAVSAAELLTSDDLHRVRECPGLNDCGWLFFDGSKNASRRWCSMEGCGSRAKMSRQYARRRGSSLEQSGR